MYLVSEVDSIKSDEYVFYNRKLRELNGKHRFKTPSYFDEELSKPFNSKISVPKTLS